MAAVVCLALTGCPDIGRWILRRRAPSRRRSRDAATAEFRHSAIWESNTGLGRPNRCRALRPRCCSSSHLTHRQARGRIDRRRRHAANQLGQIVDDGIIAGVDLLGDVDRGLRDGIGQLIDGRL